MKKLTTFIVVVLMSLFMFSSCEKTDDITPSGSDCWECKTTSYIYNPLQGGGWYSTNRTETTKVYCGWTQADATQFENNNTHGSIGGNTTKPIIRTNCKKR